MGRKSKHDPMTEAALSAVNSERLKEETAKKEQELEKQSIANAAEIIGAAKGMNFIRSLSDLTLLLKLKEMKERQTYKAMGITWEQSCDVMGLSRRTIDEKLADLRPFRDDFLANFASFISKDFNKIKLLGESKLAAVASFKGNSIVYKGEEIPLTPEHKDDIQAVLDHIQEDLGKQLEDSRSSLKAKERLLRDKDKHAEALQKEIARYERHAHDKGMTPDEDAFLRKMSTLRISIDGLMLDADPERIEFKGNPTPRMTAALIETLGYWKRQAMAAYDTATSMYGGPEDDDFEFRDLTVLTSSSVIPAQAGIHAKEK